jgi:adenylate kinase
MWGQAGRISDRYGIPAISTGDIFRAGVAAKSYMDAGEYVSDHITDAMVRILLNLPDCSRGFLLDGYPRTLHQVKQLDTTLTELDTGLDGAWS